MQASFLAFVTFCKEFQTVLRESSFSSFPSVKNPNFSRKRSQNFTQYISERPERASDDKKPMKAKTRKENSKIMNKPKTTKKSKTRDPKLNRDLKVNKDVKGGFNPQPDPPRRGGAPPGPC
jgi:hypothetical protein